MRQFAYLTTANRSVNVPMHLIILHANYIIWDNFLLNNRHQTPERSSTFSHITCKWYYLRQVAVTWYTPGVMPFFKSRELIIICYLLEMVNFCLTLLILQWPPLCNIKNQVCIGQEKNPWTTFIDTLYQFIKGKICTRKSLYSQTKVKYTVIELIINFEPI